jgi:hypothetical protein
LRKNIFLNFPITPSEKGLVVLGTKLSLNNKYALKKSAGEKWQ